MNTKLNTTADNPLLYANFLKAKRESKKGRPRTKQSEEEKNVREYVWNKLLNLPEKYRNNDANIYQKYNFYQYKFRPHHKEVDDNEGAILIHDAQGKFLQMKDTVFDEGQEMEHLDLNSAYITALTNVKNSLKFNFKYSLKFINDLKYDNDGEAIHKYLNINKFNIIKVKAKMQYHQALNMFTTNKKMKFKGREISDYNIPAYRDYIDVDVELFVNAKYKLDSWASWVKIFKYNDITYKSVQVYAYDFVDRPSMYDINVVKDLMDEMSMLDKKVKSLYKKAIVSFTGYLMHIDPARRLIMLASVEELMRRLYFYFSARTRVYGMQIDAIYFDKYNYTDHPCDVAYRFGRKIYNLEDYDAKHFSKLEHFKHGRDFVETAFRLQQIK